ncbi:MAG: tetratricopeptide repeat protein [Microcystis aeruginosa G11-09]|nr:tetratricopeptide repeat protein [Microcystis aeruginosa G11-09]
MELATGNILSHRYQIIRQLGKGGFGQTFLACDRQLPNQNRCVIKQFKPQCQDAETIAIARRLFETEAKILQELGIHRHIPRLFAYFEENGQFFLVQEYIEGEDLAREITAGVYRQDEGKVVALLTEILSILEFVHHKQVIHRDVNPFNLIRRSQDHQLVLIDFGAVKEISTQVVKEGKTVSTVAIGTPGYFPSEQAQGYPRFSSDIYATGIIGLQALTGKDPEDIPLDARTGEILWQHLAMTSAEFSYVIERMIRYDFRQRYTSDLAPKTTYGVKPQGQVARQGKSWLTKILFVSGIIGLIAGAYLGFDYWKNSRNSLDYYQQGQTFYQLKRYTDALNSYGQALKINPDYLGALQGKADTLLALKRYSEALNTYEKAIQINPDSAWQAWLGRGQALDKLGKNQEALESFDRVLSFNPAASQAWQGKADIYLELQQYSAAQKALDKLLTFQQNDAKAWYKKGWSLQNLEDYEGAVKAYDQALAIESDNALIWYQKGNSLYQLNKINDALESYSKAGQFNPQFSQAHYSQGIILQKLGRNSEALEAFTQATKANSNYYQAWLNQGALLHQMERFQEAIASYEKARRISSQKAEVFIGIGNACYRLGDNSQAITAYQQAIQRQKDNPETWKSLGNSWFKLGQYERAIQAYQESLRYRSNDREVQTQKQLAETRWQELQQSPQNQSKEEQVP